LKDALPLTPAHWGVTGYLGVAPWGELGATDAAASLGKLLPPLFLEMGLAAAVTVWPVFLAVAVREEYLAAACARLRLRLYTVSFLAGCPFVVGATVELIGLDRLEGFATVPTRSGFQPHPP